VSFSSEEHDEFGEKDVTFETNSGHATVKTGAMCNITDEVAVLTGEADYFEEHMFGCFLH
jgi:hypothetical protein